MKKLSLIGMIACVALVITACSKDEENPTPPEKSTTEKAELITYSLVGPFQVGIGQGATIQLYANGAPATYNPALQYEWSFASPDNPPYSLSPAAVNAYLTINAYARCVVTVKIKGNGIVISSVSHNMRVSDY